MNIQLIKDIATIASKFVTKEQRQQVTDLIFEAAAKAEDASIEARARMDRIESKLDQLLAVEVAEHVEPVVVTEPDFSEHPKADEVEDNG